jgi:putative ABC transport system permease protein
MFVPLLVLRNAFRHKLRTTLTVVGIVVAIVAFGMLRTIIDAWYAGANASSSARLVTRSSVSLVFPLPLSYAPKIRQVDGTGAIAGRKLAEKYGWKVGDQIPLRGTIFPGTWTFNLRGIYDGAEEGTDTSTFLFHYDFLNETIKQKLGGRGDQAGLYIEQLAHPDDAAAVSSAIDAMFRNSLAETLTETEKAFQLGFVAMSEAILLAIQAVSFVVIVIIMAVMANTMAMTARERYAEYATFKALGFSNGFVALLIFAESLGIALFGGLLGVALTFPAANTFAKTVGSILPAFKVSTDTIVLQVAAALVIGVVAAAIPAWRAARVRIVEGLRAIG